MCGIVGLFSKSPFIEDRLGELLSRMLTEMAERGPDSTGIAVYRERVHESMTKITLLSTAAEFDWQKMGDEISRVFPGSNSVRSKENHAVVTTAVSAGRFREWVNREYPALHINSTGASIEIYKEKGLPAEVIERFGVARNAGYPRPGAHAHGYGECGNH